MLWIALHLPHLPLQALGRSSSAPEAATPPRAVADDRRLIAIDRAAFDAGVRVGQSSSTALSLVPGLEVLPREVDSERAFVHQLALALGMFTPHLCPQAGGVLIEVQASLRLFGGLRRLLGRIEAVTQACDARPRVAVAPTAGAAWLLASSVMQRRRMLRLATCARRLDAVPVDALVADGETTACAPLSPQQAEALHTLGLRSLGELRALPRAGLQRRFGRGLLLALDRAYGDAPDPREWMPVPEHFALRRELMQRADDAGSLTAAVQALLPPLGGWLQLRWEAATLLTLRLRHEHRRVPTPDTLLQLRLSTPSRDMTQLALLWRERLARHALAAPVYEIALELDASVPHGGAPGELLPVPGGDAIDHAALLDRLSARLGPERVLRCEPLADHRPERAQRVVPAISLPISPGAPPPADATLPARPLWLLDPPRPLACDDHGRPLHGGALRLCSRAERIEAGWFDGALVCRDYQVAEGADHRLRWIYRERGLDGAARWFLHGWFG